MNYNGLGYYLGLCRIFSFKHVSFNKFTLFVEGVKAYCFSDDKLSFRFGKSFRKA